MYMPTAVKGLSQKLIDQFRGPYRVVGPHTSRAGALAPNVLDLIHVKSGATKSANVERVQWVQGTVGRGNAVHGAKFNILSVWRVTVMLRGHPMAAGPRVSWG